MCTRIVGVAVMVLGLLAWRVEAAPPADPAPQRGATIYRDFCASCHGPYGRGDGPIAPELKEKLPDFTDPSRLAGRSDDQVLKDLTDKSHGPMSVANALKPDALKASIAYVRTLSTPGKHVSVQAGHDIYLASGCAGCHGIDGDGRGPVAAALTDKPPRDFTSPKFVIEGREEEVARSISLGAEQAFHGSKYMPEWATRLTPQQIRDVVAYLQTFKTH